MQVVSDYTDVCENANLKVFVRARPEEVEDDELFRLEEGSGNMEKLTMDGCHSFQFDGLFLGNETQAQVFDRVCKNQIENVLSGFQACVFAYGQTGSGKTHTMFFGSAGQQPGIVPRALEYIFAREPEVVVSFLEIYCDTIRDLTKSSSGVDDQCRQRTSELYESDAAARQETFGSRQSSQSSLAPPEIREESNGQVFVKGLEQRRVRTSHEALEIIYRGLEMRATEATSMNDTSSRSHTVFTIQVPGAGKLHLVDLAGSERLKKSESQGQRLKEALHINKSLTALGKVIVSLDPSEKSTHVPYRDSKLTRLLQNALGGDSFTTVLATVRPSRRHAEESLSTLQFANRCRRVANNPRRMLPSSEDEQQHTQDLVDRVARLEDERRQLLVRLGGGAEGEHLSNKESDPAYVQSVVVSAVLAALKQAGCAQDARYDDATGGVRIGDRVIEETLPAAFASIRNNRYLSSSSGAQSPPPPLLARRIGAIFGWPPHALPPIFLSIIAEEQNALEKMRRKLEGAREELRVERETNSCLRREVASMEFAARKKEAEWNEKCAGLERRAAVCAEEMKRKHREQFEKEKRTNEDEKRRMALKLSSRRKNSEQGVVVVSTKQPKEVMLRENVPDKTKALREQYEYYLRAKDEDAATFVSQLEKYREKKRKELSLAQKELVALWRGVDQCQRVLENIRQGKYAMKLKGDANALTPDFPVQNPLALSHFPLTRRALTFYERRRPDIS